MALSSTLTGARCKLYIDGIPVGTFSSVSYGVDYDVQDVYTLGKFNAQEIVYTGMSTINVQVQGFKVANFGPYADIQVPKLQDLLLHNDITLQITDRRNVGNKAENVLTVYNVRPVSYNTDHQIRSLSTLNVTFRGITLADDSDTDAQQDSGTGGAAPASYT